MQRAGHILTIHTNDIAKALLLALVVFFIMACNDENDAPATPKQPETEEPSNPDEENAAPPYFKNNPLPASQGKLRVLAIGNSYTEDGTAYIGEIVEGLGIDPSSYCVYTLTRGSTSLQNWSDKMDSNDTVAIYRRNAGNITMPKRQHPLKEIFAQDWDVIVLQQLSTLARDKSTYAPYLRHFIDEIRANCTNPNVALAWQLIHAYGKDSPYNKGITGVSRWEEIVKTTKKMVEEDGIDIIIPTGTAIQIARQTDLETASDLTRDNTHLCYGVGRYIAASTWVQTLFSPVYDCDIADCIAYHPLTQIEKDDSYDTFIPNSSVEVNEHNRKKCLQCAIEACKHPYLLFEK